MFLASSGSDAKSGNGLVENEDDSVLPRKFLQALQVTVSGRNYAHVGHDSLGDDRRDLTGVILDGSLERRQIIPGHDNRVVERGSIQARAVGDLNGIAA